MNRSENDIRKKGLRLSLLLVVTFGCSVYDQDMVSKDPDAVSTRDGGSGKEDGQVPGDASNPRDAAVPIDSSTQRDSSSPLDSEVSVDANPPVEDGEVVEDSAMDASEEDAADLEDSAADSDTEDANVPLVCSEGRGDCDENRENGCETNLDINKLHCGECGNICVELLPHSDETSCTAGLCRVISCQDEWADCDGVSDNGCEHNKEDDGPCLSDYECTTESFANHDYYFCSTVGTWSAVRSVCMEDMQGDLATISSSDENDFIHTYALEDSWLGARDTFIEDLWKWEISGVPFWRGQADGEALLAQFENFGEDQPDDSSASENCLEILADGSWNDADCTADRAFICEVAPDDCPDDSEKNNPGQCGCGEADTDSDADGFAACNDACESDYDKQEVGICGCGIPDTDSDEDGYADCEEECDSDPDKQNPGQCGCDEPDTDTDSDGTADCNDDCPSDPNKTSAGQCGCGFSDTDSDSDGTADCDDGCPSDPNKTSAGQCGCGIADTDSDSDGTANCNDGCPSDPNKTNAGQCGCGIADTDSDSDGTANCNDSCPIDPTHTGPCLGYTPANFDPSPVNWSAQRSTTLDCSSGTVTIDTTDPDGTGPLMATITNWNGGVPSLMVRSQSGGPDVVVVLFHSLTINSGCTLRLVGSRPVIIAADGNIIVAGIIDANANGATPGAGGNWSCGSSQGGDGSGGPANYNGASGGGGGGFGTAGGEGGRADDDADLSIPFVVEGDGETSDGGAAGQTRADLDLIPLVGGCPGGLPGGCSTARMAGGGAVQISAGGTLNVTGTIKANGGNGGVPCGASEEGGGTGGGSGGGILIERSSGGTTGSVQANGGNGGGNGSGCGHYDPHCCADDYYPYTGSTSLSNPGESAPNTSEACAVFCSYDDILGIYDGEICDGGGPGGGGGYGIVRTIEH